MDDPEARTTVVGHVVRKHRELFFGHADRTRVLLAAWLRKLDAESEKLAESLKAPPTA